MAKLWVVLAVLMSLLVVAQNDLGYARNLIARGEYALATIALQKEKVTNPKQAWGLLAQVYWLQGDGEEAKKALASAERWGYDQGRRQWLLGLLALQAGEYDQAWNGLRSAVTWTGSPVAALDWGLVGLQQGDSARGQEGFSQAAKLGAVTSAAFLGGLGLIASEPAAALASFKQVAQNTSASVILRVQALYWEGRALEKLNRDPEAREAYHATLRMFPGYPLAQAALARIGQ